MNQTPKNVSQSVRDRLLSISKDQKEDYNLTLLRYVTERFLYRLGVSAFRSHYVLKGATLLRIAASDLTYRPTRDIDVLRDRTGDIASILQDISEICGVVVSDDGVEFDTDKTTYQEIKEGDAYHGYRFKVPTRIDSAKIPLQIDMGFGDAVYPPPKDIVVHTMLDQPQTTILGYPFESVVAEKFEALVSKGMLTSRMKDFYDLYSLAQTQTFACAELYESIRHTFSRRQTEIPVKVPDVLGEPLLRDPAKETQWKAFLRRIEQESDALPLHEVRNGIARFLEIVWNPGLRSVSDAWDPHQGWSTSVHSSR